MYWLGWLLWTTMAGATDLGDLDERLEQLWSEQRYEEALPVAQARVDAAEQPLRLAETLHDRAWVYIGLGQHEQATADLTRAHARRSEALGPQDPQTVRLVVTLGQVRDAAGDLEGTLARYSEARDLHLAAGRPLEAARCESWSLAVLTDVRQYARAVPHGRRVVALREQHLGPADPLTLEALVFLASALGQAGELDEATERFEQAISTSEQQGNDEALALALSLSGELLSAQGRDYEALPLLEGSLGLRRALGLADHEVAISLYNLAATYRGLGRFDEAASALDEAEALLQEAGTPVEVALVLLRRSRLARSVHDLAAARRDNEQALALVVQAEGADSPLAANLRNDLAMLLDDLGDHQTAIALLEESLASTIRSMALETVGADHADMAVRLNNLAYALQEVGEHEEAAEHYAQAVARSRSRLGADHPQLASLLVNLATAQRALGDVDAARVSADEAMAIQGRGLAQLGALSDVEAGFYLQEARSTWNVWVDLHDRPEDTETLWRWMMTFQGAGTASLERRLEAARTTREPEVQSRFDALAQVRRQLARLTYAPGGASRDATLAQLTADKERLERALGTVDPGASQASPEQVCGALEPGEVLVDLLVHGPDRDRDYLAVVVDARCQPQRIDLGAADALEAQAEAWRAALGAGHPAETSRGAQLAERVLRPLEQALSGADRLLLVPDGTLGAMPWAALPVGEGRLLEVVEVVQLPAIRNLIDRPEGGGSGLLTVGGVTYAEAGDCLPSDPLPGTAEESRGLRRRWRGGRPVDALSGEAATPAAVLVAVAGKRVVHLATHGFFSRGSCAEERGSTERNPMLRSGLVLAGPDPVLSAEAIAGADLRGTELVLLSACETGLGTHRPGEGVQGLQRGFALARARSVVMSLWSVPDAETAELMQHLVRDLRRDTEVAGALRRAQLELLTQARARLGEDAPSTWAAWVVSGR